MNFRTQVELPEGKTEIRHTDRLMLFGSCFVENIGNVLLENKFRCNVNPYGILYNPLSISVALRQLLEGKVYTEADLFEVEGVWHSWMHHSTFSSSCPHECVETINRSLSEASSLLTETDWLVVTWGTSYVYFHQELGQVVGNCHKQPQRLFLRRRLEVEEIVDEWADLLDALRRRNPKLKILLTVSPIRHMKDGMHGNQLSKSVLLLAADKLCRTCPDCFYFPSYEIVMDELRDYRFYADDMLHPSGKAVEYIWECFSKTFFSAATFDVLKQWQEIRRGINHKPFDRESEAYRKFLSQIVLKIHQVKEKFPYFEVQKELEQCQALLKV